MQVIISILTVWKAILAKTNTTNKSILSKFICRFYHFKVKGKDKMNYEKYQSDHVLKKLKKGVKTLHGFI